MTHNAFLAAAAKRRTQYALGNRLPISHDEVTAIIRQAIKLSPSSTRKAHAR